MLAPKNHGGLELELWAVLKIVAALARIDGSLGWAAMIGSGSSLFASLLPRETYDQIYRDGPDVILCWVDPADRDGRGGGGWLTG
jgi:alkylation response protein AidB-like acyl-CoA dehydrogenase